MQHMAPAVQVWGERWAQSTSVNQAAVGTEGEIDFGAPADEAVNPRPLSPIALDGAISFDSALPGSNEENPLFELIMDEPANYHNEGLEQTQRWNDGEFLTDALPPNEINVPFPTTDYSNASIIPYEHGALPPPHDGTLPFHGHFINDVYPYPFLTASAFEALDWNLTNPPVASEAGPLSGDLALDMLIEEICGGSRRTQQPHRRGSSIFTLDSPTSTRSSIPNNASPQTLALSPTYSSPAYSTSPLSPLDFGNFPMNSEQAQWQGGSYASSSNTRYTPIAPNSLDRGSFGPTSTHIGAHSYIPGTVFRGPRSSSFPGPRPALGMVGPTRPRRHTRSSYHPSPRFPYTHLYGSPTPAVDARLPAPLQNQPIAGPSGMNVPIPTTVASNPPQPVFAPPPYPPPQYVQIHGRTQAQWQPTGTGSSWHHQNVPGSSHNLGYGSGAGYDVGHPYDWMP
ncbi:hypothetical protein MKEN_00911200 [Mycena kentingensis (nom. inval.)]|nr:hypothetical protein MKEN_00911200 [Mycena kentingensis (nom. inval.)]